MGSLLIAGLYWGGDKIEMERAIDLASDLLSEKATNAHLLFVGRHDAEPPSAELIEHTKEKFVSVKHWRCTRSGTGYPSGCNDLAYGLFQYVGEQRRFNNHYRDVDAVLIFESDCAITRKGWVEELLNEWEREKAKKRTIVGSIQPKRRWGKDVDYHVNAVAMYHPDILHVLPALTGGPPDIGWDYHHRHAMLTQVGDTKLIKLDFQKKHITPEELFDQNKDVLIYHGVKSDDAIRAVRERYQLK